LKNSEVYEIPLISDEYGLYFMDKFLTATLITGANQLS